MFILFIFQMPKDVLSLKISSNLMRVASSHQHEHRWFLRATAATSKPWRSMEFLQDLRFGLAAHCQTPLEKRSRPWTWSGLAAAVRVARHVWEGHVLRSHLLRAVVPQPHLPTGLGFLPQDQCYYHYYHYCHYYHYYYY